MMTLNEYLRRATTIKLSRPEVFQSIQEQPDDEFISDIMHVEWYILGDKPANAQLPAIRQHFEFEWSLSGSCPVLMHVVYGVYDD